jgi:hypothetical protein
VLVADPTLLHRLEELLPSMLPNPATTCIVGFLLLGFVALYVVGSILHLRPLITRKAKLECARSAGMVRSTHARLKQTCQSRVAADGSIPPPLSSSDQ